jgi:hypothetical protein
MADDARVGRASPAAIRRVGEDLIEASKGYVPTGTLRV